jgi:serine/threonine-protein kinase
MSSWDESGLFIGRYRLVKRLGSGGMAEVWKAELRGPAGFERALVVKRVLPHLVADPGFVRLFVAEARLSALLHHSNIVQVHELVEVEGEFLIAMEYIEGLDLLALLKAIAKRGEVPPPGLGAYVMREVCRALAYAHDLQVPDRALRGIIHRDVSPSNVLCAADGGVKLLDFGVAKAIAGADDATTRSGLLRGKLGYIAPEQLAGSDADARTDQFAAGVVLWEALTGQRLFAGNSDPETMALVRATKVEPPSREHAEVPAGLDRICQRALAQDPGARFASCAEMAEALDQEARVLGFGTVQLAQLVAALKPSASAARERVDGAPRRRPRSRLVGLIVGGALMAFAVGATWWGLSRRAAPPARAVPDASPPVRALPEPAAVAPEPMPAPAPPPKPAAPLEKRKRSQPKSERKSHDLLRGKQVVDPFAR